MARAAFLHLSRQQFSTLWVTYEERYTAYKYTGEMMQLAQSSKGKGSSRTSSRGKLAVLSQAFPCSLSHRPGQVCQQASGTPAVVVWAALTAFPPLTAGSGCSQQPLALLPLQKLQLTSSGVIWCPKKIQVSYLLACPWTIIPCTTELQPLSGRGWLHLIQ